MTAPRAGATDESEEPVSEETHVEQTEEKKPSFLADLLKDAADMGHIVGEPKLSQPPPAEPAEEEKTEEEPAEETEPEEEKEEVAAEADVKPPEGEHKSIDEQIKEFTAKGEKPPWYLSRIAEESRKRRERTEELEKSTTRVKELEGQLAQRSAPQPNRKDPLADIFDEAGLAKMKDVYRRVIRLAELNPNGVNDEVIGKNPDGTDKTVDYSREQLVDMKLEAQDMLNNGIPERRKYIANRAEKDEQARKTFPEFADEDSGWTAIGQQFLSTVPELQRDPEVWLWIGRALRGWQWELAQSKSQSKTVTPKAAATKIVESAREQSRVKKAPVTAVARGFVRRPGADLDQARKELQEKGDAASAEKYLESLGVGGQKSKRPALVES